MLRGRRKTISQDSKEFFFPQWNYCFSLIIGAQLSKSETSGFSSAGWQKTWDVSVSACVYISIYAAWPWIHQHAFKYSLSSLVCFPERGFRPVTNFMRNLSALSSWYSVYTSAIAFIVSHRLPRRHVRFIAIKFVIGKIVFFFNVKLEYQQVKMGVFTEYFLLIYECPFFLGNLLQLSADQCCLCVHHRSTCMQPGMAGPSQCSCSSLSSGSPWITSLPGHFSLPDLLPPALTWQSEHRCVVSVHWHLPVCSHDALLSGVGGFSGASYLKSPSPWWGLESLQLRRSGPKGQVLMLRSVMLSGASQRRSNSVWEVPAGSRCRPESSGETRWTSRSFT